MTDALINSIDINKSRKGKTVLDVPANELINSVAMFFKEKNVIKLPKWSSLVKCSHANEIVPLNPDYMYYKAAAIARMLYITKSKTVGVGSIRTMFGKKERRGAQPAKFMRASGKIIRVLLQQLKENKYVENYKNKDQDVSYGLVLTSNGRTELDKIASKIAKKK
jgi:small subunit ribosomal protein S19e